MAFTGYQQSTVPRPFPNSRPCSSEVSELNTMFSEAIPISRRNATQNWWVLHMFRTLGIPTRIPERSLGGDGIAAEAFLPNHVCNIGKGILGFLDSGLDHFNFVKIFHEPLGKRSIYDDALPSEGQRNLAPLAAHAAGQRHVDETALAIYGTPVADGILRGGRRIRQFFNHVKAAELRAAALFPPVQRNKRRADRAGFSGIRMHDDVRVGNF